MSAKTKDLTQNHYDALEKLYKQHVHIEAGIRFYGQFIDGRYLKGLQSRGLVDPQSKLTPHGLTLCQQVFSKQASEALADTRKERSLSEWFRDNQERVESYVAELTGRTLDERGLSAFGTSDKFTVHWYSDTATWIIKLPKLGAVRRFEDGYVVILEERKISTATDVAQVGNDVALLMKIKEYLDDLRSEEPTI